MSARAPISFSFHVMQKILRLVSKYCPLLFFLSLFYSCNLGLTKCEEMESWEIEGYKIIKSKCLGPAGPHYYPISVYKDNKFLGENGIPKDSCITAFQARNDLYIFFNVCEKSLKEIRPEKKEIKLSTVDSIQIYSNGLNETKFLTKEQVEKFIGDWNKSKVSDYRNNHIDSIFFPTFQYKFTVFSRGGKREFLGANYLISGRTHWTYYITDDEDTKYFYKLWRE